jgi:hypothetical protein
MDIHMTQVNLAIYGNGVYHMAVKIYNALPNSLKLISEDIKTFKDNLREFLYFNSFCTLDEFFTR